MKKRRFLWARLAEPSTWAGMSGFALALGASSEEWESISLFLAAGFGLVAMVTGEKDA